MKKLLFVLIIVWLIISISRTIFNVSKIITEEKNWIKLTEEQKREKLFADLYPFYKFIEKKIPQNSTIAFLAPGGKAYYLGRYYLYPRRLIYLTNSKDLNNKLKKCSFNYLVIYQTSDPMLNENNSFVWNTSFKGEVASYFSKDKFINRAKIYKL